MKKVLKFFESYKYLDLQKFLIGIQVQKLYPNDFDNSCKEYCSKFVQFGKKKNLINFS